jgi:hypothetical protein
MPFAHYASMVRYSISQLIDHGDSSGGGLELIGSKDLHTF